MKTAIARRMILVWLISALSGYGQVNQESSSPESDAPTVRVVLGSASANPGESTVVPVYFTPASDTPVGRLKLQVTFVSANLKFDKVETGIAAEIGNVSLTHDVRVDTDSNNVEVSTLTMEATAAESSTAGIPSSGLSGRARRTLPRCRRSRPWNRGHPWQTNRSG